MNSQNRDKLKMFLKGLEQRMTDNAQFFKSMKASFFSGTKEFKAEINMIDSESISINFNGRTETLKISGLSEKLAGLSASYDRCDITFLERGTAIIINADNKGVKIKYTDDYEETFDNHAAKSMIGDRDYYIKVGQADRLLKEIGILTIDGKVKNDMIRKYNQIDHFVELIDKMLDEITEEGKTLTVLDCGCGKSYLTFVLNYYLKEVKKVNCFFIGLDISEGVISTSKKMADNLGYKNMAFYTTDIDSFIPDRKIDLVISLHACDTATDQAIALGIRSGSKAIVAVPCCHREILSQYSYEPFDAILKYGVFKARMADTLTDGIRALLLEAEGYDVSVVEYISPLETPKNLMIRALKNGSRNKKAWDDYLKLKKMLNINPLLERFI